MYESELSKQKAGKQESWIPIFPQCNMIVFPFHLTCLTSSTFSNLHAAQFVAEALCSQCLVPKQNTGSMSLQWFFFRLDSVKLFSGAE